MSATGIAGSVSRAFAERRRQVKVGHTGITWPWGNPSTGYTLADPDAVRTVVKDIASLGFHGFELFGWQIEGMEPHGGLGPLLEQHEMPLVSSYVGLNLTDPAQRTAALDRLHGIARLVKKYGGAVIVLGPNAVNRELYRFAEHKHDILQTLDAAAKAVVELGLTPVLHQHTGTCIESRDETYAVMEAADPRYLKFGPDIGQLAPAPLPEKCDHDH